MLVAAARTSRLFLVPMFRSMRTRGAMGFTLYAAFWSKLGFEDSVLEFGAIKLPDGSGRGVLAVKGRDGEATVRVVAV